MAAAWIVGVETDKAAYVSVGVGVRRWSDGYVWWDMSEDWVVVSEECGVFECYGWERIDMEKICFFDGG